MDELTAQYAQLFHFTAADLEDNRRGVLSESQYERLRKNYRRNVFFWAALSAAAVLFPIVFIRIRFGGVPPGLHLPVLFMISLWVYFLTILWLNYRRRRTALRERVVEMTSGILRIEKKSSGNAKVRYANVEGTAFQLSDKQGKFLGSRQGKVVQVYSIPKLRRIVSLERYNTRST
jgi:hypothetical protein